MFFILHSLQKMLLFSTPSDSFNHLAGFYPISRREVLFLFEAYSILLRAGTDVAHDTAWKQQVDENKGILVSIDGIQADAGNETIYLVRDVLTGRMLNAENTTESTKERLKQILSPVVALCVPILGVISDAQLTELQAVAELWPDAPHQICQFHALRDAGRLIFQADTRVRNDLRGSMKEKTQKYRHNLLDQEEKLERQAPKDEQEVQRLHLLDEYAATVEVALQIGSKAPFEFGGLAIHDALIQIQQSLETLKKRE
jgi:transposase